MKKIGAMALALILMAVLLLAGCQNKQPDDKTDPSDKLGQMLQVSSTVFKKLEATKKTFVYMLNKKAEGGVADKLGSVRKTEFLHIQTENCIAGKFVYFPQRAYSECKAKSKQAYKKRT